MKLTIEQIKGINVEAYIDWIDQTINNMRNAFYEIPVKHNELTTYMLNGIRWDAYFATRQQTNRFAKYKDLRLQKIKLLENEISILNADLELIVYFVDSKYWGDIIRSEIEHSKNNKTYIFDPAYLQKKLSDTLTIEEKAKNAEDYFRQCFERWRDEYRTLNYRYAEHAEFENLIAVMRSIKALFNASLDVDMQRFKRMQSINANAMNDVISTATNVDFANAGYVMHAKFIPNFFDDTKIVLELGELAYYSRVANDNLVSEAHANSKIKWLGKPTQLGYFMGLFADLGYIDAPKKMNGEINYSEYARQLANKIDYNGNNVGTLTKAVNIDADTIGQESKKSIKIPHIKDLS